MRINIKPLSVNRCWQGRRFKTKEYKEYEQICFLLLKPMKIPEGYLEIHYVFGVSNFAFDTDNGTKPIQDILQKKYNFNDNRIVYATIRKVKVKKGDEFVEFDLKALQPPLT